MPLQIIRDDITKVKADAIVNSANPGPVYGRGMDLAVYRAAGAERLLMARRKLGQIAVGETKATYAYKLPAKYILHTVGPQWEGGNSGEFEKLARCYQSALALADQLHLTSVAFPLISTGVYGFPKDQALSIAVREISAFLQKHEMDVSLVVFDRDSFCLSQKITDSVRQFIDERYVAGKTDEEYGYFPAAGLPEEKAALSTRSEDRRGGTLFSSKNVQHRDEKADEALEEMLYAPGLAAEEPEEEKEVEERVQKLPASADRNDIGAAVQMRNPFPSDILPRIESIWKKETAGRSEPGRKYSREYSRESSGKKRSLQDVVSQVSETFQERLLRLIDEKGMTDPQVYKKANIDRKLFSKIRCNPSYRPGKQTVVALAMALHLNLDETKDLLGRAEYAFSPSSKFDLIIQYCIENEIYDSYEVNLILFDYEQPLLGCS